MRLIARGWVLIGIAMALVLAAPAMGQVTLTTVADTVYSANGSPAQGTVVVSWNAFTTSAGKAVAAGQTSAVLGAGGLRLRRRGVIVTLRIVWIRRVWIS